MLVLQKPAPLPIPLQVYAYSCVAGLGGQVIAYPVGALAGGSALDQTRVLRV